MLYKILNKLIFYFCIIIYIIPIDQERKFTIMHIDLEMYDMEFRPINKICKKGTIIEYTGTYDSKRQYGFILSKPKKFEISNIMSEFLSIYTCDGVKAYLPISDTHDSIISDKKFLEVNKNKILELSSFLIRFGYNYREIYSYDLEDDGYNEIEELNFYSNFGFIEMKKHASQFKNYIKHVDSKFKLPDVFLILVCGNENPCFSNGEQYDKIQNIKYKYFEFKNLSDKVYFIENQVIKIQIDILSEKPTTLKFTLLEDKLNLINGQSNTIFGKIWKQKVEN